MSMLRKLTNWNSNRRTMVAAIILFVSITSVGIGYMYHQYHVSTTYDVYLNGNKIGVVDDPEVVQNWIDKKVEEESNRFKFVHIQDTINVKFEPEERYKPSFDNKAALQKLGEELVLKANAAKITIDGQFIGYASDEDSIQEVLDSFKREYVPEELLLALSPSNEKKKNTVSIASMDENDVRVSLDQPKLLEVNFKQDIQVEDSIVDPREVLSSEQLKERLFQSKMKQRVHTVQAGDVLGTIAMQYGLTSNELLDLNPELTKDSILQIGQQLVFIEEKPFITVSTVEKVLEEEVIDFKVETKKDPNMYLGESRIEQEGKEGKKIVEYKMYKENGQIKNREVVSEDIIVQPVNKVVVRGDKIKPSRGSGQFSWPTVGGRITSGFGPRGGGTHTGIDIAGVNDRTIKAADNGTVTTAGWHNAYGNYAIISHNNGYQTLYAHMSSLSVKRGDIVQTGEKLGVMGSTGQSTGIHLHFEVIKNGRKNNPMTYLRR